MVDKKDYARDIFRDKANHCVIAQLLSFGDKFCGDGDCRNCDLPSLYFLKPENKPEVPKVGFLLTEEELAEFIHEAWMHWVRNIIDTEIISEERRGRWLTYLVPYNELDEGTKELDRRQVVSFLNMLGDRNENR